MRVVTAVTYRAVRTPVISPPAPAVKTPAPAVKTPAPARKSARKF